MFKIFSILLLLSANTLIAQEAQPQELEWLLILDFASESGVSKADKEKAMGIIRNEIEKLKVFKVREKDTANQIIDEKVEELRGCVEAKCSVMIGKFADVPKVLDGTINKQGKGFNVTWNLFNVESEQIEFSNSFKIDNPEEPSTDMKTPGERLKAFVLKIPFKEQKPRLPYVWRSAVLPGWGQLYDGRNTPGYLFTGFFLTSAAYYYTTLVAFQKKEQAYKSTPFLPASDAQDTYLLNSILLSQTRSDYKTSEKTVNNAFYFLAGIYVWNLVDAFVYSGRQEEKKENLSLGIFPRWTSVLEARESTKLETYYQINYNFRF
ncbi:MAG: hypothetical protein KBA66_13925 [Leptospiraceae bacterium]|nr:hypothetical protein [Leptospiraceae bacterium]